MRKEPFGVGSFVHVYKRGTRRMDIVRDDADRWRFLKLLRYLNDANVPRNWERDINKDHIRDGFKRPTQWKSAEPYVSIVAYCLMDNHFHLLLQERIDGGVAKLMQRLCTSMASTYNLKYQETGTLFQGSYHARTIQDDAQLQHLAAYIHVKNPFQRYPGGIKKAIEEYDAAYEWAVRDPFCGLGEAILIDRSTSAILLSDIELRRYAWDMLSRRGDHIDEYLLIDENDV
jgi:REP element-mobilizing transposase RayT